MDFKHSVDSESIKAKGAHEMMGPVQEPTMDEWIGLVQVREAIQPAVLNFFHYTEISDPAVLVTP